MSYFKKYKRTNIAEMRPVTDGHISDFKKNGKLLFANDYIKLLKSEIKELEFKIGIMISDKNELIDTSKMHRVHESMKFQIKSLEAKNKKLKTINDNLLKELVEVRKKIE